MKLKTLFLPLVAGFLAGSAGFADENKQELDENAEFKSPMPLLDDIEDVRIDPKDLEKDDKPKVKVSKPPSPPK